MSATLQDGQRVIAIVAWLLAMSASSAPAADLILQSGFVENEGEQICSSTPGASCSSSPSGPA
jgi:hypothetical protein